MSAVKLTKKLPTSGQQCCPEVAILQELANQVRLTPSYFWEILRRQGFDPSDFEIIKAARGGQQVKRLHLAGTDSDSYLRCKSKAPK